MDKVHIVVGDFAASVLKSAFETLDSFADEIFIVKDIFNVGQLRSDELPFSALRSLIWQEITGDNSIQADDLERLMTLSTKISNNEIQQVWFWMSAIPADVCTYYWLLHFLKKHIGKLLVININGLPFLDDEGKLFYPESIAALPQRQVLKAQRLARVVTPSEWETDGEEWKRLIHEQDIGIRINLGGKQIQGKPIDFYDRDLLNLVTQNNQKITKLIGSAMQKHKIYTGDTFLIWRLKQLAQNSKISINKDSVKLFSSSSTEDKLFENLN